MTKSEENQLNDLQKSIDHGIYMYLVFIVSPIVIFLPFKFSVVSCVIVVLLLALITAGCSNEISSTNQLMQRNLIKNDIYNILYKVFLVIFPRKQFCRTHFYK